MKQADEALLLLFMTANLSFDVPSAAVIGEAEGTDEIMSGKEKRAFK